MSSTGKRRKKEEKKKKKGGKKRATRNYISMVIRERNFALFNFHFQRLVE